MRDPVVGRALLVRQDDLYAAVLLPTALGAVVREGVRRAVADGLDARRIDAAREQCVADGHGSSLGKLLVRRVVADGIRVTFDANRALRVDAEQLRKSIDIDKVAFLPKPFSVQELAEAARKALTPVQ